MFQDVSVHKRQLWGLPTTTSSTTTRHCTPFTLPSNGVISFGGTTISLNVDAVFKPECTGGAITDISTISGGNDPFYASTIPQTYVIAATTVIAWILVIMLVITPRTNFLGQTGTAPGFNSGHGIIGGSTGGNPDLIGIGSRPWLQKVAAFTVAISLTIATADTFKFAQRQYAVGYMDATSLRNEVLGSLEIRTMRVITDVFLWLAQVQTLIRLFPRHKEKVLIKWIGFALILFDSVFSCLNSFMIKDQHTPRQFADAIPALSYLFELALGLLYAAWVIYYALTKRRYAFYHHKMPSICLIALLSLIAILTPVVFFVTDVSSSDIAGWGDYFRWVGAAAASVVVWEWVERIEALERDEKKDGILGREIFDGDEMLDVTPSDEVVWTHSRFDRNRFRRDGGSEDGGTQSSALEKGLSVGRRLRPRTHKSRQPPTDQTNTEATTVTTQPAPTANPSGGIRFGILPRPGDRNEEVVSAEPAQPPRVISPVSRADTNSAASTVYVVQYNPAADVPQPIRRRVDPNGNTEQERAQARAQARQQESSTKERYPEKEEAPAPSADVHQNQGRGAKAWVAVSNPFKRKRASPPAEVQKARLDFAQNNARASTPAHNYSRWDVKGRLGVLAAETGERLRERLADRRQSEDVPVTIIPAQPRGGGRTWMPPEPARSPVDRHSAPNETGENVTEGREASAANETYHSELVPDTTTAPVDRSGTSSATASEPTRQSAPRADDIVPIAGSDAPVIIPAPRRSARNSPLAERRSTARDSASEPVVGGASHEIDVSSSNVAGEDHEST